MDRSYLLTELTSIFRDVLDDPEITISDDTTPADIDAWDSLAQIMLLSAIEDAFGLKFSVSEVDAMKSVKEIMNLIDAKTLK